MTLFNKKEFEHENIDKKCNSCMFRERWAMGIGLETSQYCSVRPSNRTKNGLLKIKASDAACPKYFHSITKPKLK